MPLFETLHLQTAPAELFSGEQGMTGCTGQLPSGSWSAIFPQAISMNEKKKSLVSFAVYIYTFYLLLTIQNRLIFNSVL